MKAAALILGIVLLIGLGAGVFVALNSPASDYPIQHIAREVTRRIDCESNSNPVFTHHITDIESVNDVQAPPRFVGEYLKTHSYIGTGDTRVPIYAPVDMTLSGGSLYADPGHPENYILDFDVSCEIRVRYDHVTEPVQEIVDQFSTEVGTSSRTSPPKESVEFKAGDIIGYTTRMEHGNWDFGVYNNAVSNRFAEDSEFSHSETYTSAVCPFDFFLPELRQEYYERFIESGGDDQVVLESFCTHE